MGVSSGWSAESYDPYEREKGEEAVDRERTRRAGLPRLLVLCAVLFGLFAMHGAPANAAAGCHGETAMPAPATARMAAPMSTAHADMRADTQTSMRGQHHAAPVTTGTGGELCVSTPARERLSPAAAGLLAVLGLVVPVAWGLRRTGLFAAARRGPPLGGRGLLLQVCVART
ncbi:hypothetical protein ACFPFX_28470 [Streptomyces mauvecolor]|uniref:Uncharacterized protein n=1 Tax=Streptomyces mauvecolor TaxID=58345 RepID=A0ABV9UUX6_9ACTN